MRGGARATEEFPIDRPDDAGSGNTRWIEWDDPNMDNWDGNDCGTLDGCDIWNVRE